MAALEEFLQAKFPLDQRSLNQHVWEIFAALTAQYKPLNVLDVGTGTGSMLRRLIQIHQCGTLTLTGLDRDADLLRTAARNIADLLQQGGFTLDPEAPHPAAWKQQHTIEFIPICAALADLVGDASHYHMITAHAFMDLVPLAPCLTRFNDWLRPGGVFYGTINYDGETVIFPPYHDTDFEDRILAEYDASMERRRERGEATGGAQCGRRLYRALQQSGFQVIAYGSSDWNITPVAGSYRDDDRVVLHYLLQWIFGEAEQNPAIDTKQLTAWRQCRQRQLANGELGIIIHQVDILARKI